MRFLAFVFLFFYFNISVLEEIFLFYLIFVLVVEVHKKPESTAACLTRLIWINRKTTYDPYVPTKRTCLRPRNEFGKRVVRHYSGRKILKTVNYRN